MHTLVRPMGVNHEGTRLSEQSDVEAWAADFGGALVRLAFVLTGDGDEAQDIVQTVFLRLMGVNAHGIENPQAYTRRAVANEVISRQRRQQLLRSVAPKLLIGMQQRTTPDPTDVVAARHQLVHAMSRLTVRQRTVLVLRYFEDLDDRATGEILGCSPATVRSIAARALAKLRINLSDDER